MGVTVTDEPPKRIRTDAPPAPLPETWARALANDIAAVLRRGWRSHSLKRAISSTGDPITGRDYAPTPAFPRSENNPTTEKISEELYAWGLTDPIPTLGVPALVWHLTQLDLAEALNRRDLMRCAHTVDTWLRHKPPQAARPASVYLLKTNRHGKLNLRRNSDHTPLDVVNVFLAAVEAATVTVPDPLDLEDHLAEWDSISPETVFGLEEVA